MTYRIRRWCPCTRRWDGRWSASCRTRSWWACGRWAVRPCCRVAWTSIWARTGGPARCTWGTCSGWTRTARTPRTVRPTARVAASWRPGAAGTPSRSNPAPRPPRSATVRGCIRRRRTWSRSSSSTIHAAASAARRSDVIYPTRTVRANGQRCTVGDVRDGR